MATWTNLSIDSWKAAEVLHGKGRHRSAVSRAYYAAYAAVTAELVKTPVTFGYGGNNPAHSRVLDYIWQYFPDADYAPEEIQEFARNLRDLLRDRVRADYYPTEEVDELEARENVRRAEQVLLNLGLPL